MDCIYYDRMLAYMHYAGNNENANYLAISWINLQYLTILCCFLRPAPAVGPRTRRKSPAGRTRLREKDTRTTRVHLEGRDRGPRGGARNRSNCFGRR